MSRFLMPCDLDIIQPHCYQPTRARWLCSNASTSHSEGSGFDPHCRLTYYDFFRDILIVIGKCWVTSYHYSFYPISSDPRCLIPLIRLKRLRKHIAARSQPGEWNTHFLPYKLTHLAPSVKISSSELIKNIPHNIVVPTRRYYSPLCCEFSKLIMNGRW